MSIIIYDPCRAVEHRDHIEISSSMFFNGQNDTIGRFSYLRYTPSNHYNHIARFYRFEYVDSFIVSHSLQRLSIHHEYLITYTNNEQKLINVLNVLNCVCVSKRCTVLHVLHVIFVLYLNSVWDVFFLLTFFQCALFSSLAVAVDRFNINSHRAFWRIDTANNGESQPLSSITFRKSCLKKKKC